MADAPPQLALSDVAARQLANATKTPPQMSTITPRWLVHLLAWVPVEAGIYRVNKVKHPEEVDVVCSNYDESPLPTTFVDYEENPREYLLNSVSTIPGSTEVTRTPVPDKSERSPSANCRRP